MTTPIYNPKIPIPSNSIAQGQPDFLTNFSQLALAFGNDHVALDATSNPGNHSYARLVERETGSATGTSEIALYSKNIPDQTDQLIFRTIGNGQELQYSNFQIYPLNPIEKNKKIVQIPYFSFLPGGIIVYFGSVTPSSNPFPLILEPAICTNIFGVNIGVIGMQTSALDGASSAPSPNQDGKYGIVNLEMLSTQFTGNTEYNYIIYGAL